MNERRKEITVGVAVTAAILILVLGVAWGKKANVFRQRKSLTARFESVRGLESGDPVTVRGVPQGEVSGIGLEPDGVLVAFWVKGRIPVRTDATAMIDDRDLMGGKQLVLDPGIGSEPLARGAILPGSDRFSMLGTVATAGRLIERVDSVLARLKVITDPVRWNRILDDFDGAASAVRTMAQENRAALRSTVRQLDELSATLNRDSTASKLGQTLVRLDSTVAIAKRLAIEAESQDGTLKRLVRDPKLYERLVETTQDLDSLIADFKQNPKKYIHVSVF